MSCPTHEEMDAAIELIQLLPESEPITQALTRDFLASCVPNLVSVAERLASRHPEVSLQDLVQEGALELARGNGRHIRKFELGRRRPSGWVKYLELVAGNAMRLAIAKSSPVYLSDWSRRRFLRAKRMAREFDAPLVEALALQGLSEESQAALAGGLATESIDASPDGSAVAEHHASPGALASEALEEAEDLAAVRDFVEALDAEHAEVIALSFGLDEGEGESTDAEIARALRIPLARVALMRERGLEELRALMAELD